MFLARLVRATPILLALASLAPLTASATVVSRPAPLIPFVDPSPTPGASPLPWTIGDIANPAKIPCFQKTAPTDAELVSAILGYRSGKKIDQKIATFTIQKEDIVLVDALSTLLKDKDGKSADLSTLKIAPRGGSPLDAVDAARQIFGEREGVQILYLYLRYRMYASPYLEANLALWTAEELDDVLLGLSDLPKHLVPFPLGYWEIKGGGFQPLLRSAHTLKVQEDDNSTVIANSEMLFFDAWDGLDSMHRRDDVFHEASHNLQYLIYDRQNWTNLSPWPKTIDEYTSPHGVSQKDTETITTTYHDTLAEPFVTQYAKASPAEDFAESSTAYRYRPDWLLAHNPAKYAYLKEVIFDGIEYTSEAACTRPESTTTAAVEALKKNFVLFQNDAIAGRDGATKDKQVALAKAACDVNLIYAVTKADKTGNATYANCVADAYADWFNTHQRALDTKYPADDKYVRAADQTGGGKPFQLTAPNISKLGAFSRTQLRNAVLQDFRGYSLDPKFQNRSCGAFAQAMVQWMSSQGPKSAVAATHLLEVEYGAGNVQGILGWLCQKIDTGRPVYQSILAKLSQPAPLTYAELQSTIDAAFGK
jgi:hypothetical protein